MRASGDGGGARAVPSPRDEAWVHVPDPRYDRYGFQRPPAIASLQQEFEVDYARRISQQERRWRRHEATAREDTSRTKELKRLARNGIPPGRRGEIWQQMAGADGLRSREVTGYFEGLVLQEEEVSSAYSSASASASAPASASASPGLARPSGAVCPSAT